VALLLGGLAVGAGGVGIDADTNRLGWMDSSSGSLIPGYPSSSGSVTKGKWTTRSFRNSATAESPPSRYRATFVSISTFTPLVPHSSLVGDWIFAQRQPPDVFTRIQARQTPMSIAQLGLESPLSVISADDVDAHDFGEGCLMIPQGTIGAPALALLAARTVVRDRRRANDSRLWRNR
jgi:hypothetical protein